MDDLNAPNGAIPPPPDGSGVVASNPSTAPSADSQPGDTQPGSIPPPPDGSAVVSAPAPAVASPAPAAAAAPGAQTPTPTGQNPGEQVQGFVKDAASRLYEGTLKGPLALARATIVDRPVDHINKAIAAARKGDWATAADEAATMINTYGGSMEKDHPLRKAAEELIMQPIKQIEAAHKADLAAGGALAGAKKSASDLGARLSSDKGDVASQAGDLAGTMNSHAAGAIPLVGGAINQLGANLDADLHGHQWGKVAGDVASAVAQIAALKGGSSAAEGAEDTTGVPPPPSSTGVPPPPDGSAVTPTTSTPAPTPPEALATPGAQPSRLTRAANTVEEANQTAATAPTDEAVQNALQEKVEAAHAPAKQDVSDTYENTNKNILDKHQTDTAEGQAKLAQAEYDQHLAEQEADKQAALAPGDESITNAAKKAADKANDDMHTKYQGQSDKLMNQTKGTTVDYEAGPIHTAAKELLGKGAAEGPLTTAVTKTLPGSPQANAILKNLTDILEKGDDEEGAAPLKDAEGNELSPEAYQQLLESHGEIPDAETEANGSDMLDEPQKPQVQMPDLMKMYKKLGENQRSTGWATSTDLADQQIYGTLKKAVIDTISQIAEKSGNPDAITTAEQMNTDYRNTVRQFENPAVKALRSGKLSDVDKYLSGGQASIGNINALKQTLGSHWEDFSQNSLRRLIADTVHPDGSLNYKGVVRKIATLKPELRQALYGQGANTILQTLNKASEAADTATAAKEGLESADAAKTAALEGTGKTVAGKTAEINKAISDIVGNGDLTELLKDPARRTALQEAVGPAGMRDLAQMTVQNQIAKASSALKDGQFVKTHFNADKFLDWYHKFADSPEATDALFRPDAETAARYSKLMSDMQNVSSVQKLVKNGVIPLALSVGGATLLGPWGALIGGLLRPAEGAVNAIGHTRSVLDSLASHPAMWKVVGQAGKVVDAAKGTKVGNGLKGALDSTASSLGGKSKKLTAPIEGNPSTGASLDLSDPDVVVAADKAITNLPQQVQNAVSTIPVNVQKGQTLTTSAAPQGSVASVDQGAGNNTVSINSPKDFNDNPTATMGHELTHVWQNNLPPSVQAKIPDDPQTSKAFDISDADKLRKQGKTLSTISREKAATIVQKYIEDPKKNANLKPWIDDMGGTALSSTMPTAPDATRLNMTPRPPGRPALSVAGAYAKPKEKGKK